MEISLSEDEIDDVAKANFILLSLYREYSIIMLNDESQKVDCCCKMQQIKKDIRYLSEKELLEKAKKIYLPILREVLSKK